MIKFFITILFLVSCQTFNSNTADEAKYAEIVLENNPEFRAAYQVLQNRCINCHMGSHNTWATYVNSQLWINAGEVIAGNSVDSKLVRRIINSGESQSDMPPVGGSLPTDEYQSIKDWIDGL